MKLEKPSKRLLILAAVSVSVSFGLLIIFELNAEELRLGLAALYVLFVLVKAFSSAKALDVALTWAERELPPKANYFRLRVTSSALYRRFKRAA